MGIGGNGGSACGGLTWVFWGLLVGGVRGEKAGEERERGGVVWLLIVRDGGSVCRCFIHSIHSIHSTL